jgi:hypothetical protein
MGSVKDKKREGQTASPTQTTFYPDCSTLLLHDRATVTHPLFIFSGQD